MASLRLDPEHLTSRMKEVFAGQMMGTQRFMTEELSLIKRRFGAAGRVEVDDEKVDDILLRFKEQGVPGDFRDLRICIQAMDSFVDTEDGAWSPFDDPKSFELLVLEIDRSDRSQARQRLLAQAGLYAYLTVPGVFRDEQSGERSRWRRLGQSLRDFAARSPDGDRLGNALTRHEPLLGSRPAQFYAERLLDKTDDSLELMARELSIPGDSWFWVDLILEQIKTLDLLPEAEFKETWPQLLERAREHESIMDRALAGTMDAFGLRDSSSRDEAQLLIDLAGERWGNPLVKPDSWLAWVTSTTLDRFRPWVSEGMIDTFFRFLAEDRGVAQERPRFWKRYSEHITEIRIVVANGYRIFAHEELKALRDQMGRSHFRQLEEEGTHVFIMKIGQFQFCEISKHGNAAYFHESEFIDRLFESPGSIPLRKIKQEVFVARLRNAMSSPKNRWTHQGRWQKNFVARINVLADVRPRNERGRR